MEIIDQYNCYENAYFTLAKNQSTSSLRDSFQTENLSVNKRVFFKPAMLHSQATFHRLTESYSIAKREAISGLLAGDYLGCAVVGILRLIVFGPEDGLIFFKQLLKVGKHKLIIDGVRLA